MDQGIGPFIRKFAPNGKQLRGSDLEFSLKVKKAGFEIWYHKDYICDHFKECSLNTVQYLITKAVEEEKEKYQKEIDSLEYDIGLIRG